MHVSYKNEVKMSNTTNATIKGNEIAADKKNGNRSALLKALAITGAFIVVQHYIMPEVFAAGTTDASIDTATTKITGWLKGSIGKVISIASFAIGIVGSALKFNPLAIAGSFGVGLAASLGPGAIETIFSAII